MRSVDRHASADLATTASDHDPSPGLPKASSFVAHSAFGRRRPGRFTVFMDEPVDSTAERHASEGWQKADTCHPRMSDQIGGVAAPKPAAQ